MTILSVVHRTRYLHAAQVNLGPRRTTMRPRDSLNLLLIDTALTIAPAAPVRWLHGRDPIRVAVARDHSQAIPLSGNSTGRRQCVSGNDRRGRDHGGAGSECGNRRKT